MEFNINYEYINNTGKNNIFTCWYMPKSDKDKYPLVIISHGFMANYQALANFAVYLAEKGVMALTFDFCGGSSYSKSEGEFTSMSVLTEEDDLERVIEFAKTKDNVDTNNIFLLGESQGALVSSFVAAKRLDIKGLVLLYPSFVLFDDIRDMYKDINNLPTNCYMLGYKVGRNYITDIYNINPFDVIKDYKNPVLIIHGTKDTISPIDYSEVAIKYLNPKSELLPIDGAAHGFKENEIQKVYDKFIVYLAGRILNK
ncbi:MAG: alpha/beta hydrolase [Bacilli bacterium]|nr:alpha/beta hydrolase [Bacilli bacterium]